MRRSGALSTMSSKRPNPSSFQTPAPALPQPEPAALDDALDRCAVRRLQQLAERPPLSSSEGDERATLAGRKGKVALHNGHFLRRTLAGVESHNRRVTPAALARPEPPAPPRFVRGRSRSRSRSRARSPSSSPDAPRRVEVVLEDDRPTGILFEKHESGRPAVLGFAASCPRTVAATVRPGMVLSKIAGERCKYIEYDRALELVRALEKPLRLEFRAPRVAKRRRDSDRRRRRRR